MQHRFSEGYKIRLKSKIAANDGKGVRVRKYLILGIKRGFLQFLGKVEILFKKIKWKVVGK